MEFLNEYGLFLAKAATLVVAALALLGGIVALTRHGERPESRGRLDVRHLNHDYENMALTLKAATLPKKAFKQARKEQKAKDKQHDKTPHRRVFVLNFHGDLRASAVAALREEVTAVLIVAQPEDEVVVRLESAGGLVHAYGLAAAQLLRIRDRRMKLTVAVDKVAASGGYLMACVANRVVAAPFAIIGSIGVIAQIPNFNKLLRKHDIAYEQITAGEFKRTLTMFGENTDHHRQKMQHDIEQTHGLFKDFVREHRPALDIERVATGEHWLGSQAMDLGLVDELGTSDDLLMAACEHSDILEISHKPKHNMLKRIAGASNRLVSRIRGEDRIEQPHLLI